MNLNDYERVGTLRKGMRDTRLQINALSQEKQGNLIVRCNQTDIHLSPNSAGGTAIRQFLVAHLQLKLAEQKKILSELGVTVDEETGQQGSPQ